MAKKYAAILFLGKQKFGILGKGQVGGEEEMGRDIEGMSLAYIIPFTLKLYGFHCTRQEKVLLRTCHM